MSRPGLTWWERLLWVVLAWSGLCGVLPPFRCGHTIDVTAERTEICRDGAVPGAGTGAPVLFPGPAGDGGTACDPENPERQMIPCRPVRNLPGQAVLHEPSRPGIAEVNGLWRKGDGMNALSAAAAYYLAAGRREEEMDEDGRCQDVYVRTPELVLMARRVDSSAPFGRIIDVRCRFETERCDAWHLHFLAGEARELLTYEREILSLPWF